MDIWEQLETATHTTTAQRHALYRLGYSKWLVGRMDRVTAEIAIRSALKLIEGLPPKQSKE